MIRQQATEMGSASPAVERIVGRSAESQARARLVRRWSLPAIGALAIALRLAYVLAAGKESLSWGDEFAYDALARSLAAGHGFVSAGGAPTLFRAPLYPLLLAGVYAAFGHSTLAAVIVQAVIGGLAAPLLVLLGRQLTRSDGMANLAGLMFACHPLLIFATGLLYSETVYLTILLIFTLMCLRMAKGRGSVGWALGCGAILGLSALLRPNMLLFPVALFAWLWISLRRLDRAFLLSAALVLAMAAVILPWTWRNYRVSGAFVPVSANSGLNLWQGNHPEADGAAYPFDQVDPLPGTSEVERDAVYRSWALEEIRSDPGRILALIPRKVVKFFAPLETSNRGRVMLSLGPVVTAAWTAFLLIACLGFLLTVRRSSDWILVALLILYPLAVAMIFYGATRYGMVVYPYLFLLASVPLWQVAARLMTRWHGNGEPESFREMPS
jgi:4-amino-4-deoxy-L-arabinose transferase-like glycosyltransferase